MCCSRAVPATHDDAFWQLHSFEFPGSCYGTLFPHSRLQICAPTISGHVNPLPRISVHHSRYLQRQRQMRKYIFFRIKRRMNESNPDWYKDLAWSSPSPRSIAFVFPPRSASPHGSRRLRPEKLQAAPAPQLLVSDTAPS
jgi:hypothetical protein